MSKQLTIGLFGFGCVGQGLYDVLTNSVQFKADFKKICIKHPEKKRTLPGDLFTANKWELLNDEEIDTIVELIDDSNEAYEIIVTALRRKKNVVTANKKVLAEHLEELLLLQKENNVSLIYEAAVCGGIPIIRTLEEYYDNESLQSVSGIFNGSSNFILSKIFRENLSYDDALKQAQELGFAETDPTLDVEGFDPKFKLTILALHAFGVVLNPEQVFNSGINHISDTEKKLYKDTGIAIKLNPVLKKVNDTELTAFVLPQLIDPSHKLYEVNNEYNAVIVEGVFSNEQLFIGKGAGGHPTGSAVLSDISALSYDYKYSYKKYSSSTQLRHNNQIEIPLYFSGDTESLADIFEEKQITETETGGIVLAKKTIDWLIVLKDRLSKNKLFVAQIHEDASSGIKKWKKQFENAVITAS